MYIEIGLLLIITPINAQRLMGPSFMYVMRFVRLPDNDNDDDDDDDDKKMKNIKKK